MIRGGPRRRLRRPRKREETDAVVLTNAYVAENAARLTVNRLGVFPERPAVEIQVGRLPTFDRQSPGRT
jgi:hypothetical protein